MIVLDKSRALDLMIARAERVLVPDPFGADSALGSGQIEHPDSTLQDCGLTNLLRAKKATPAAVASAA